MATKSEKYHEEIREKLRAILKDHVGARNAISLRDMVSAVEGRQVSKIEVYDGAGRTVRREISNLIHTNGLPIMSTEAGYFLVGSRQDLEECAAMFRSRALAMLAREAKLKRVSLVEVSGQLALDLVRKEEQIEKEANVPTQIPARYEAITKFLDDPLDADTLGRLQKNYGALFMPRKKMEYIKGAVKNLMEMLEG